MIRISVLLVSISCLVAGIAFSTDNPADVETEATEEGAESVEAVGEDAPLVDGVFNEEDPVEETDSKSAKVDKFYGGLTSDNIASKMEALYAPNVQFTSPFITVTGRDALAEHYKNLFSNLTSFELEITEEFISGQETVLIWEVTFSNPKLSSGEKIKVSGVSHLAFANDLVISQKDYFDAGSVVYENVTFVGWLVRWVKGRVIGS